MQVKAVVLEYKGLLQATFRVYKVGEGYDVSSRPWQ
jgi:hypothetical protein